MLLRHENVQLEEQLPQNWRIVDILNIADMVIKKRSVQVCNIKNVYQVTV